MTCKGIIFNHSKGVHLLFFWGDFFFFFSQLKSSHFSRFHVMWNFVGERFPHFIWSHGFGCVVKKFFMSCASYISTLLRVDSVCEILLMYHTKIIHWICQNGEWINIWLTWTRHHNKSYLPRWWAVCDCSSA